MLISMRRPLPFEKTQTTAVAGIILSTFNLTSSPVKRLLLSIVFDKAGEKRVVDSFVERV
jgi:hypothetical protein